MLKGEEFLALGSNLIDPKGENNIKIANVLMGMQSASGKLYEGLLSLNVLDELQGIHLDKYGAKYGILRQGLNDVEFRALIKALSIVKFKGSTYNALTRALATFLNIPLSTVSLEEISYDDTGYPRFSLIKHIVIKAVVDKNRMLAFFYNIKAAGIIVACYKYQLSVYKPLYGLMYYTGVPFQPFDYQHYMVDCNGVITDSATGKKLKYEYDLHEYDLNELKEMNDGGEV